MRSIALIGAGGHAKVVYDALIASGEAYVGASAIVTKSIKKSHQKIKGVT